MNNWTAYMKRLHNQPVFKKIMKLVRAAPLTQKQLKELDALLREAGSEHFDEDEIQWMKDWLKAE